MGDHFSKQATSYSKFRPSYPAKLFEYLASLTASHDLAWDCACGNGQATAELAGYYDQTIATDISATQIENALLHPKITYQVAAAEQTAIEPQSLDIVTVAQALHWFNFDAFYAEVDRVLKPGGILTAWTYNLHRIEAEIDAVVEDFYHRIVGSFWPPERKYIEEKYETIPFPYALIEMPNFEMTAEWDLSDLIGYLGTWSSTQYYKEQHGQDPVDQILDKLTACWGDPQLKKDVVWPFYLKVGKKPL